MKKPKSHKDPAQIRIMRADMKDMIRDELYGAGLKEHGDIALGGKNVICIPVSEVKKIAKRIAKRAMVGH